MSYLALARKWRPRRFEDVMGQSHVVRALTHALDGDRLHPAILLTGTRGIGKTTLARIIAKSLNCETGVTSQPCGVCSACTEVDGGRFVDLLEIDAASNTGVDNVRELIDNAQYAPARGRYKVYLIDEVHMLSKSAFNALLKTLEEPPPQVKFILATTDPQKLPITVLSRCLQFNLKRLPAVVIREQLASVLREEGIEADSAAIGELARAADGSMRDGLSLLDQAIAFAGGERLERAAIEDMLGTAGREALFRLLDAIASADGDALLTTLTHLDAQAPDYTALLGELAACLQRIAVLQLLPAARNEDDDAELVALAGRFAAEDVQLYYQIAVIGRRDLPWAPEPRLGFEMSLLRMLAFRPDEDGAAPRTRAPDAPPAVRALTPSDAAAASTPPAPGTRARSASPAREPVRIVTAPRPPAAEAEPPQAVAEPMPAPADREAPVAGLPWDQRVALLDLDPGARALARQCAFLGEDDGQVRLSLPAAMAFLVQDSRRLALEAALTAHYGRPSRVSIELIAATSGDDHASPAQLDVLRATERQRNAEIAIANDPVV